MKNLIFLTAFILLYSCKEPNDTIADKKSILLKEKNNNVISTQLITCYNYSAPDPKFKKEYADWVLEWQNNGGRIAEMYVINNNDYDIMVYSKCNSCLNVRKWFKNGKPDVSPILSGGGIEFLTKSFIKSKDSAIMYLNYYQSDSLYFDFDWQKVGLDSIYRQEAKIYTDNGVLKAYPTKYVEKRKLTDMHQYHRLDTKRYIK